MVEQWTENPCVPGSIPGGTTKIPQLAGFFVFTIFLKLHKKNRQLKIVGFLFYLNLTRTVKFHFLIYRILLEELIRYLKVSYNYLISQTIRL